MTYPQPNCTYREPDADSSICPHYRTWPSERAYRVAQRDGFDKRYIADGGQATCRCHTLEGKVGEDTRFFCDPVLNRPNPAREDGRWLRCFSCGRVPEEILEYSQRFTGTNLSPDDYVWLEEGTLNRDSGQFACTACYIDVGQPSAPDGWKAP